MTEIRVVVACQKCAVFWDLGSEAPLCTMPDHVHQRFEVHRHRDVVVLPDHTVVTAVSFAPADPYARADRPDFGLYLDPCWNPPWQHASLEWPDFGVPTEPARVVAALRSVLARAQAGQRVELGCRGGHGRTGTALACLAVLTGYPSAEAVAWVRAAYCAEAVETAQQEAFAVAFAG
jgi:hypothetical protein